MPERVTGLDIGRDGIKAVSVSPGLKGYHVIDVVSVRIAESGGLEKALEKVFEREAFRNSPCVTAIPLDRCSFRNVRMPFKDRKRINQTLPYELEQSIPYPIERVVIDYLVTGRSDQTEMLAAIVRENELAERLESLSKHVSSFPVVDVEEAALAYWLITDSGEDGAGVLIDAGAAGTSLAIVDRGRIVHLRSFPFGGNMVVESVAAEQGIDLEEAGKVVRSGDPRSKSAWVKLCSELHREVQRTIDLLRLRGLIEEAPRKLCLAGGCSQSAVFRDEMGRLFSLYPQAPVVPQEQSFQFTGEAKENWNPALFNQALALALREAGKVRGFNFVRGRSAAKGIVDRLREELPWLAPMAVGITLLLGANLYFDYRNDTRYLALLQAETRAIFQETLPGITRIVDPVQQMRTALEEVKRMSAGQEQGTSRTVLSILRDMSVLVPASVEFVITNFTYDGQTIRLQGETDNFNTVDAIRASLERGDAFESVTITSANMMRQGGRVTFDLRMEPGR